jgi:hypothetical protein
LFLNNKNKGIFKGKKRGFEKTKREEEPNERKTKKQKKEKKKNTQGARAVRFLACFSLFLGFILCLPQNICLKKNKPLKRLKIKHCLDLIFQTFLTRP